MVVQKISALFRRTTLKHDGDFYCLNCLYSFRTKNKLESHKTECENKYLCGAIISYEDTKILELNQFQKSDETLSIIYIGLESLIQKVGGCKNNSENLFSRKVSKHISCGYSMSTIWTFDGVEKNRDVYRGEGGVNEEVCEY